MQKRTYSIIFGITAALFAAVLLCRGGQLSEKARAGDTASQIKLAGEYFYGRNRRTDLPTAFYWFRRAAVSGSPEAQYNLALMLDNGWGCEKNPAAAYYFYEKARKNGIIQAAVPCARMLFAGIPAGTWNDRELPAIKKNETQAIAILMPMAKKNDASALLMLAKFMFANAAEHGRELRLMLDKYMQSTAEPDPEAMLIYAACLRSGIGGHIPDPAAGAAVLRRAAEKKHPEAMAQLAEMLLNGFGIHADREEAMKFYTLAMRLGSPRAMTDIAIMKLAGVHLSHDPRGAFELLNDAAAKNYPPAQQKLGDCYAYGIGTEPDAVKAFALYQQAADAGNAAAMYRLGECFRDGKMCAVNPEAAFYYFREAALDGHIQAMRETGKALLHGKGVKKDQPRALEILRRAAAAGDKEAAELLR